MRRSRWPLRTTRPAWTVSRLLPTRMTKHLRRRSLVVVLAAVRVRVWAQACMIVKWARQPVIEAPHAPPAVTPATLRFVDRAGQVAVAVAVVVWQTPPDERLAAWVVRQRVLQRLTYRHHAAYRPPPGVPAAVAVAVGVMVVLVSVGVSVGVVGGAVLVHAVLVHGVPPPPPPPPLAASRRSRSRLRPPSVRKRRRWPWL